MYAALGTLGVVTTGLDGWRPFRFASAALLLVLAVGAIRAPPPVAPDDAPSGSLVRAFAGTVLLTLANPATIASFAAASTALGVRATPSDAVAFALSVFAGSAAWWIVLSAASVRARSRLGPRSLRALSLGSAALLAGFAVRAVLR